MRQVYLDHQSATPVLPEVLEAMRPFFAEAYGNPSSLHRHGLLARDALDRARSQIAAFINAESPEEIIFTSDGTESANLAIKGAAAACQRERQPSGHQRHRTPGRDGLGRISGGPRLCLHPRAGGCPRRGGSRDVRAAITDKTILVSVHHVNHEIGAIQPVREIGAVARERGIAFYVDAEAGAGWLPVDAREWGAGLLSFSPHRFYGPKGVGVLYQNRRARLAAMLHGGDQENGRRAGVENVPAIVGAGVAAEIAGRELAQRRAHCARCSGGCGTVCAPEFPISNSTAPNPAPAAIRPR
jgi:cysteine desulfurase